MLKAIYAELGAYKGLNGKTATIGGCLEYTGAPYYAAAASLRAVTTMCFPIKSYSPELIVHPVLLASNEDSLLAQIETWPEHIDSVLTKVTQWFPAIHTLIVGPGLGRDLFLSDHLVPRLLAKAVEDSKLQSDKLMVIDADGINVVCRHLGIIRGYPNVVLTPNAVEFARLWTAAIDEPQPELGNWVGQSISVLNLTSEEQERNVVTRLARALGGCTVLLKVGNNTGRSGRYH